MLVMWTVAHNTVAQKLSAKSVEMVSIGGCWSLNILVLSKFDVGDCIGSLNNHTSIQNDHLHCGDVSK